MTGILVTDVFFTYTVFLNTLHTCRIGMIFTTNGLSYAEPDVDKFDMSNHVHVWDHSYSTSMQSVEENCICKKYICN
jgi:hypothetical protein